MAQIELAHAAVEDLDRRVLTHSLPDDTRQRVRTALEPLRQFLRLGPELAGRWDGFRFMLGPWRWMLLVYTVDDARGRVVHRHDPRRTNVEVSAWRVTGPHRPGDEPRSYS